jgi:hypothetical protein
VAAGPSRRGAHIRNKEYAAIFRPLFSLAHLSRWTLSLQDDAQVELGYEFSFAVRLPSLVNMRLIMPCMSVIFEGLRGGARQPMLILLGVEPARSIVIEDAIVGVEAGHTGKFGLVVGVARKGNAEELRQHGAQVVVNDLSELVN